MEATLLEILERMNTTPSSFDPAHAAHPNDVVDVVQASSSEAATNMRQETVPGVQVNSSKLSLKPFEIADVEQLGNSEATSSKEDSLEDDEGSMWQDGSLKDGSLGEGVRPTKMDYSGQAAKELEDSEFGINVSEIQSRNAYNYALRLMDVFFTKQEMAVSLLFKSRKSSKPALAKDRVEKLLSYVEMRYGSEWDLKILTAKANQKCRDSRDSLIL